MSAHTEYLKGSEVWNLLWIRLLKSVFNGERMGVQIHIHTAKLSISYISWKLLCALIAEWSRRKNRFFESAGLYLGCGSTWREDRYHQVYKPTVRKQVARWKRAFMLDHLRQINHECSKPQVGDSEKCATGTKPPIKLTERTPLIHRLSTHIPLLQSERTNKLEFVTWYQSRDNEWALQ